MNARQKGQPQQDPSTFTCSLATSPFLGLIALASQRSVRAAATAGNRTSNREPRPTPGPKSGEYLQNVHPEGGATTDELTHAECVRRLLQGARWNSRKVAGDRRFSEIPGTNVMNGKLAACDVKTMKGVWNVQRS